MSLNMDITLFVLFILLCQTWKSHGVCSCRDSVENRNDIFLNFQSLHKQPNLDYSQKLQLLCVFRVVLALYSSLLTIPMIQTIEESE